MNNYAERLKLLLSSNGKTIAVAESLTAGNLQTMISSVSGASDYFLGGVTAYNIDQKVNLLGVDRQHAQSVNCISPTVAEQMASGAKKLFGADITLATTGYAEPWPAENIENPFAFYAIDMNQTLTSGRIDAGKRTRIEVQTFVAETVLSKLLEILTQSREATN